MSDKMRGALFNILGDIEGLTVLDVFAGTGALSFEAISRGARFAMAIEMDTMAQQTIANNIKALQLQEAVRLSKMPVRTWLQVQHNASFDLVLCDPPYHDLQLDLIAQLMPVVAPNGMLVLSCPSDISPPLLSGLKQLAQRTYGDAQLVFYARQ
jgi:16S rRNA (guanine966-N2)-methyltransferase